MCFTTFLLGVMMVKKRSKVSFGLLRWLVSRSSGTWYMVSGMVPQPLLQINCSTEQGNCIYECAYKCDSAFKDLTSKLIFFAWVSSLFVSASTMTNSSSLVQHMKIAVTVIFLVLTSKVSGDCTPCYAKLSRWHCVTTDGCRWRNRMCLGNANCASGGGTECTPGSCSGSPDPNACNLTNYDPETLWFISRASCNIQDPIGSCSWNNTTKTCEVESSACKPVLSPIDEYDCKSLGCNWTAEDCGNNNGNGNSSDGSKLYPMSNFFISVLINAVIVIAVMV